VGAYAREIGVQSVVISPQAPVFSAFGIAGADIVRFYQQSSPMVYPWNVDAINALFDSLEEAANRDIEGQPGLSTLVGGGSTSEAYRLQRIADLRYRRQTHELRIDVPTRCLTDKDLDQLVDRFEQAYEKLYGKGTSYRQAGIELSTVRVRSALTVAKPDLRMHELQGEDASAALKGSRDVYFDAGLVPTPIYSADRLVPGNVVTGPTVIEGLATTVVVHPGQRVQVDAYGNFLLHA
jgi:N-methylhydantoinase A